ncbi:hypothetical protein QFC20_004047 [Naganishia adeliensis]|uniref:Uncharacterized protein n=1 Tax=Naganishia adeliensis TaxID=92952 RepID=A0ACC2W482_9TREE|nr:hypothetical protein QFC20_004047 [Naganishia adeliensis]
MPLQQLWNRLLVPDLSGRRRRNGLSCHWAGNLGFGFTIILPPSSEARSPDEHGLLSESDTEQPRIISGMEIVLDSARDSHADLAESPPLPQKDMFTPLSPVLSPEPSPSAMDTTESLDMHLANTQTPTNDTLFTSFSAIRLNTPRKRQHPDDTAQEANADGTLDAHKFESAGHEAHPKKKRPPGVE